MPPACRAAVDEEQLHQARPVCFPVPWKGFGEMQVCGKGVTIFSHNTLSCRSSPSCLRAILPSEHLLRAHIEAAVMFYLGVQAAYALTV